MQAGPLMELKTVHYAPSTYPASEERCIGVSRRAGKIGAEYLQKARSLDRQWHYTGAGQQGPVEARLRGYGTIRALVFGSWGEASADVEWLLSEAVDIGLSRRSGFRPADDDEPDSLRATLLAMLRRRWGIAALRANARLLLERLAFVGRGGVLAMRRRVAGRARAWRGPRVWPLRF